MKRTFAALGVVGLGLISVTAPAMAAPERVIVCHSDGGSWKPLEFNVNGLAGHDQHPLDIIPPTSTSPGKNWTDAGKLLYADKCAALPPGETLPEVNPPADEVDPPADQVDPPADQVDPPADQVDPPADQVDPPAGEVDPPPVETPTDTPVIDPPGEQPVVVEQTGTEQPTAGTSAQTPAAEQPAAAVPAAAQAKTDKQQGRPTAVTGASPAASSLGTNQGYNAQTAIGGSQSAPSWLAGLGALAAAGAAVALRRRTRPFTPAG